MTDVCLILEGTYPYVRGGVSSCVLQMIKGTPQIRYGIVYIGANKNDHTKYECPIPENIDYIKEYYLNEGDYNNTPISLKNKFDEKLYENFFNSMINGKATVLDNFISFYFNPNNNTCNGIDILRSQEGWNHLQNYYSHTFEESEAPAYLDFFYNWRSILLPIFNMLNSQIPHANVYHSISTGYAGLFGVLAKVLTSKPFLITEHGIYSHEREIEISKSDWLSHGKTGFKVKQTLPYFKDLWINMFHFMSKTAYQYADKITTLNTGNIIKQLKFGAPKEKLNIIPNGIKYDVFSKLKKIDNGNTIVIGLVGRVVPIKDIKTFIKVISIVKKAVSNIDVMILGSYDEDPDYYLECKRMITLLDLEDTISFTGMVDLREYYPKLDLMVLTSISEGQPIVILEAFTVGLPCVATDVGSCKELILGMDEEDAAIGPAGGIAPFGQPNAIANEIIKIITNKELSKQMIHSGQKRVQEYYTETHYLNNYLNMYHKYLNQLV